MSWESNYLNFKKVSALDSLNASARRQGAFESFQREGLPTRRDEAWKFTSLNDFKGIDWKTHGEDETHLTHEQMQEISKQLPSEFLNFVFVNGVLNRTLSDDADGLLDIGEPSEQDLAVDDKNVDGRLIHLARAFTSKKINMRVGRHKSIEKTVQVVFVQSSRESVYLSEKLDVVLEEDSEMKLLLHSISFINAAPDAMNLNVNIRVDRAARLTLVQLQDEDAGSFHFSQCEVELAEQSQLRSLAFSLGNRLTRNYFHMKFAAENAEAEVYGLGVLDENQHLDNYTFLQHAVGNNHSVQHYKSILAGSAHSVFRGRVLIEPDAQKADSEQLNNNLLLTRNAQADSVPQLEIYADDVKAGHGSTVGQLNKDEIFYFLSRGINQFQAVKMLSYGFAKELLFKIENPALQEYLLAALNRKLERMVQNG